MKILFWDIETSPNLAYVWGKYQQDVVQYEKEWEMLSFAYKWKGSKEVICKSRRMYTDKTDKSLLIDLHKIISEADVLVAHNGDKFDLKKARSRMIINNLPSLKPIATIDTLKEVKKHFNLNSHKLDDVCRQLDIGRKLKGTSFDMWLGCMRNDKASWKLMEKYNKHDIVLLEGLYNKMLPWMVKHPNMNNDRRLCPKCGSNHVNMAEARATNANVMRDWKCQDCKGYFTTPRLPNEKKLKPGIYGEAAHNAKLTELLVRIIRKEFKPGRGGTVSKLAKKYGVSNRTITKVGTNELWRHVK